MAEKKVEPGHVVVSDSDAVPEITGTALDALEEQTDSGAAQASPVSSEPKAPATSTRKKKAASGAAKSAPEAVVLKKGATFGFRGRTFKKGVPEAVDAEAAERLIASGYFERG